MGMDVVGRNPRHKKGEYFRASVWSWRPIHCLIQEANERFCLGIDLTGYDCNSGDGLRSHEACVRLADAMAALVGETNAERFTLDASPTGPEAALLTQLKEAGFAVEAAPCCQGVVAVAPLTYAAEREHVEEFIEFLRACGGFAIW